MGLFDFKACRECRQPLSEQDNPLRLCHGCQFLSKEYQLYDALREEGYMPFQAKLMAGLADPPDPDDE